MGGDTSRSKIVTYKAQVEHSQDTWYLPIIVAFKRTTAVFVNVIGGGGASCKK